jgi:hypothetical protein
MTAYRGADYGLVENHCPAGASRRSEAPYYPNEEKGEDAV